MQPRSASRRRSRCALALVAIAFFCSVASGRVPAALAGDRALGEHLSAECATCHQSSGRQVGAIPAIIGHPADQFVALMAAYRDGQRENQIMRTIAGRLSSDEIAALAAYYEGLKPAN
jgi:cytochrome c553